MDVMPLAAYCAAFARWKTTLEAFDKRAGNDPVMHGLLVKGSNGADLARHLCADRPARNLTPFNIQRRTHQILLEQIE